MNFKDEIVSVVDVNDDVVRKVSRKDVNNSDILRASCVFIIDKENKILLQLRSKESFRYPAHWDCTAGGHVESDESYHDAAKREMLEETGIKTEIEELGKDFIELSDKRKHFVTFFKGDYDGKIDIDKIEVDKIKAFSIEEIKKMIENNEKFHPDCLLALKKYFF